MTDQHDNERIRRGLAVLVEEAPLAPEFDELTTTRVRPVERTRHMRPLVVAGVSAAAVMMSFVAGGLLIGQLGGGSGQAMNTPATPTTVGETSSTLADLAPGEFPRVSLNAEGWSTFYLDHTEVEDADGHRASSDIQFNNGSSGAELRMNSGPNADLEELISDREKEATRLADQPMWGTTAAVVSEEGSGFIAMWEGNDVVYEFIVLETDEETFRHILGSLTRIAEDEWVASLPDDIVTDRAEAVTTYLEGIPLPRDFDSAALEEGPVEHWYQVAADTVGAVTCSWIEHWIDAKGAGDAEAIQQAVGAMATSSDWQVLNEMSSVGDYPKVVEEYADAIAGDGTIVAGSVTTVEATYQQAFGCGS